MKTLIFEILNELSVPCNILGRDYLEAAIDYVYENGYVAMTKKLYPKIAERFNTTPNRVERTIRHAIELSFSSSTPKILNKYFGNTINYDTGKLANGAYIYGLVKYIKTHQE